MKYIRTKDGVYEIERYFEPRDYYWVKQDCDQPIGSDEIIKQADTIEELCDEFCLLGNDGTKLVYNISDWLDLKEKILSNKAWIEIYGAIWTDKGLIYVAQLNDKGEWGLL